MSALPPAVLFRLWLARLCEIEASYIETPYLFDRVAPSPEDQATITERRALGAQALDDAARISRTPRGSRHRLWQRGLMALGAGSLPEGSGR